ncbi:hypothetical protein GW764_02785 [Candidatus Parcubacteria bacterium]|nr:hypothetical protein [Candidatus Parcubacteria bacterium]
MSRKLSKKEEGELVTKGFLYGEFREDFLEEIDKRIDTKISAQTGVLMEDLRDQLKGMMEAINMRFEMSDRKNEERFSRIEARLDADREWLRNHEMRISKLEYKNI